jgi:hypothetical protein
MSLSSLKEINLDFSWFEDTSREKSIEECLQIERIPINSWILVLSDDDLVSYCAKKWPYHKFVTFSETLRSSNNIHVFNMTLDEFANNTNKDYDNFILKNRVGYRGVILSNFNESTLKQIDKQLYKDYGNTIQSKLVIYSSANNIISNNIPCFKETLSKFDGKTRVHTFSPISDFNIVPDK